VHPLKLHAVLQAVMGWNDRHLHFLRFGDIEFGTSAPDEDLDLLPEGGFRLEDLAHGHPVVLEYVYDTGDNWTHLLEVRPVHTGKPLKNPVLLKGERASPPEDSGGPAGTGGDRRSGQPVPQGLQEVPGGVRQGLRSGFL